MTIMTREAAIKKIINDNFKEREKAVPLMGKKWGFFRRPKVGLP